MPLNLSTNDGEFTPYLKYNAKAGRFYVRMQGASADTEVQAVRLAIDMENARTGWFYYPEGAPPEKVWDPTPDTKAPRPAGDKKFKRGFELMTFGADPLQELSGQKMGLREWSSTAGNTIAAILKMHAAYEAGMGANPGKVPCYKLVRVVPEQGAYGINYEPVFDLVQWVDRAKIPQFDEYQAKREDHPPSNGNGHTNGHTNGAVFDDDNRPPPGSGADDLNDPIPF